MGIEDEFKISPKEWFLELAGQAYNYQSGGVVVQQSLVEAIVKGYVPNMRQQEAYNAGLGSNFLVNPPVISVMTNGASFGMFDPNLFGQEASDRIRQKHALLKDLLGNLRSYKGESQEKAKYIEFHAGKLELMVDMLESALERAKESGYTPPPELDVTYYAKWGTSELQVPAPGERAKWQAFWRKEFGEELPTIYQLISKAKQTLIAATS